MNRITRTFAALKAKGHQALIGYLTAGDPDLKTSERRMRAALQHGVDILEIGVPFSDPTADGPTIQAAGQRALAAGTNLADILTLVKRLRRTTEAPLVLFSYVNPLLSYGYARLCKDAAAAGADALLVVDLPFEETGELRRHLQRHRLPLIPLIAPTTPRERMQHVLTDADGFVYYILVKGVTGARATLAPRFARHLAQVRTCTNLPIAVGFGISSGAQARAAARHADAVVVGSALVQAARENRLIPLVRALARAVHRSA